MRKLVVIVVLVCFGGSLLAGCATTDAGRTKTEGTAVGAGAGALIGGLLGALIGGRQGAAIGAAIGAGVGGVAGYAYGSHVAEQKQKFAKEEDWLNACVASVQKVNEETCAYCSQLATESQGLETKTATLLAQYEQKSIEKSALEQERQALETKRTEAEEKLKRANFELQNQEKVLAEVKSNNNVEFSSKLESEISALKKNIADLETHTSTLASMSQRMAV